MRCKDFEQDIFLYRELAEADRKALDNHLTGCEPCRALFVMMQQTEALISETAFVKPQPENASKLTSNIMQAVADEQKQKRAWFTIPFLRYGMATVSFVLIVTFSVEEFSNAKPLYKRNGTSKPVTLNSASFMKAEWARKNDAVNTKTSLYACVKSNACDNSIIENFKKKSF